MLDFNGAPERIRTSDPQIRSLVLYPAELRARGTDGAGPPSAIERRGRVRLTGRADKGKSTSVRQNFPFAPAGLALSVSPAAAPSRAGSVPVRLLDDFTGILQTDGYSGYGQVCRANNITRIGCWDQYLEPEFIWSKAS